MRPIFACVLDRLHYTTYLYPMTEADEEKMECANELLADGDIFVHLDPRKFGVLVPQHLKAGPRVTLQVGLNMAIQIRDLEVDARGIRCTLSFNRRGCWCEIPWHSVFQIDDGGGHGKMWYESVPAELLTPKTAPVDRAKPVPTLRSVPKGPPRLHAIQGGKA